MSCSQQVKYRILEANIQWQRNIYHYYYITVSIWEREGVRRGTSDHLLLNYNRNMMVCSDINYSDLIIIKQIYTSISHTHIFNIQF